MGNARAEIHFRDANVCHPGRFGSLQVGGHVRGDEAGERHVKRSQELVEEGVKPSRGFTFCV